MNEFLRYHRRIFLFMLLICGMVCAGLAAGVRSDLSLALGFACGAAAQLLKFGVIDVAVVKRIGGGGTDAAGAQLKATFLSLAVLGFAVVAVYKLGGSVWAMAAGIFLPRVILVADAWIRPNPFAGGRAGEEN